MATILVADDAPNIRTLLRVVLQPAHRVIEADDGEQALTRALAHRPALAILDITMPGLTGLDVCRRLRENPDLQAMPVIIITANGAPGDRATALEAGADYFLTKPFSPAVISELVTAALGDRTASAL
jgi:CheY-like chemotaxis protein